MDRRLILDKLESLRRCVRRVESRRPDTLAALEADLDLQDILALNLTRAVQVSVDVAAHLVTDLDVPPPGSMAGVFEALGRAGTLPPAVVDRMRAAVGFRNVAVHAYQSIDWAIVFCISHDRLGDFRAFAQAVVGALDHDLP